MFIFHFPQTPEEWAAYSKPFPGSHHCPLCERTAPHAHYEMRGEMTQHHNDLIYRLRKAAPPPIEGPNLIDEAADRICALEVENDALWKHLIETHKCNCESTAPERRGGK
jgi:hypothetical protein